MAIHGPIYIVLPVDHFTPVLGHKLPEAIYSPKGLQSTTCG